MVADTELKALVIDRQRLLRAYAPTLKRVRGSTPRQRSLLDTKLTKHRRQLRKALHLNAEALAARCMTLFGDTP